MKTLKFALIGAGFWSRYQLAAWRELAGAQCMAICNRTQSKAKTLADEFSVPHVYDQIDTMLDREELDFVDIVTDVDNHPRHVQQVAARGLPVICQKPMASSLAQATEMVDACRGAGVPFQVHENWRWQRPLRELKAELDRNLIGRVFRARIDYINSFPVFENQPFLKTLETFIIADMGSHILDVARFLFGEASSLYCQTARVHPDIQGEDVASVHLRMPSEAMVSCHLSYASRVERDHFPETFVLVEGDKGSLELGPDYWVRTTTEEGTRSRRVAPPHYAWADPRYALVHSSIVECHRNLLHSLRTGEPSETSGEDNLKTMELVYRSYESQARNAVIPLTS